MYQKLDETDRGSVKGVFVMFHLFKQATPSCRTSFEGQGFRREAHQLGSSATSEEAPCQPHDDPDRGAHSVDRRNFKASNGWLEKFLLRHNLVSRRPTTTCQKRSTLRRSLITYCLSSRGVAPPIIHTSMLPTRRPSTWISRAV